jgi:hypothetical protein
MNGLGDDHILDRRFSPEDAAVSVVTGAPVNALIAAKSGPSPATEFAPAGRRPGRTTSPRLAARPAPWAPRTHAQAADGASAPRVLSALHTYGEMTQSRIAAAPRPIAGHSNMLRLGAPPHNLAVRIMPVALGAHSFAANTQAPQLDTAAQAVTSTNQSRITPAAVSAVPRATYPPSRTTAFAALPHTVLPSRRRHAAITIARANPALPTSYQTTSDESLAATAARLGVSPEMLASVNKLPVSALLARGTTVLVPRTLTVSYLGKEVKSDVPALMVGSTSTTAFRFLFEAQGGTVQWDSAHHRVVAQNGDQQVVLQIGSRAATVNDQKVMMDLAAYLLSGRTMVPVRLFEKALHAQVEWEPTTGRMLVSIHNSPKVG